MVEETLGSMAALLRRGNSWVRRHPLATATSVTGAKACAADLVIQTIVERREKVDRPRAILFGSFGCLYQGCFQYWMYNHLYERLFPGAAIGMVVRKVLASNLISDPCFFFPCFYTMREIVHTRPSSLNPADLVPSLGICFSNGMTTYSQNYWQDWLNSWSIWVPGYAVTYGVCPVHLRMPFIAAVSFGYVALLSSTRGDMGKGPDK